MLYFININSNKNNVNLFIKLIDSNKKFLIKFDRSNGKFITNYFKYYYT